MTIRNSTEQDFKRIMEIYAFAREFMKTHGNPNQWGPNIEPTYKNISEGKWTGSDIYGVVHRLAGDGSEKGIGAFCIEWAFSKCGNLRKDTHGDNIVMQNLLMKIGFTQRGTIYVEEDNYPRLAFEKTK